MLHQPPCFYIYISAAHQEFICGWSTAFLVYIRWSSSTANTTTSYTYHLDLSTYSLSLPLFLSIIGYHNCISQCLRVSCLPFFLDHMDSSSSVFAALSLDMILIWEAIEANDQFTWWTERVERERERERERGAWRYNTRLIRIEIQAGNHKETRRACEYAIVWQCIYGRHGANGEG